MSRDAMIAGAFVLIFVPCYWWSWSKAREENSTNSLFERMWRFGDWGAPAANDMSCQIEQVDE